MIKLEANFPQYFDVDGSALDGGSIYFGAAGMNPETSPIVVFSDQDGTLPVPQPLRTVGGSIVYGGANIHVFADVLDYSYTVRNKRGELVSKTLHFLQDIGAAASLGYAEASEASAVSAAGSVASISALADAAATSAVNAAASAAGAASQFDGANLIDNGELMNVFRRVGTTPPQVYTSGQFVIDRWKAGSSGLTRGDHTNNIAGKIRVISGTCEHTVINHGAFNTGDQVIFAWDGQSQLSVVHGCIQQCRNWCNVWRVQQLPSIPWKR